MAEEYLAFDLGASSGRLMRSVVADGKISLEEVYRFANAPVYLGKYLYWDIPFLIREMKEGLRKAAAEGCRPSCIGIDTWGVDYGYIGADGSLLGLSFCYRDARNQKAMETYPQPFEEIYPVAGLQQLNFNTAYQLWDDLTNRPGLVGAARRMLMLSDLLGYFLTGEQTSEYTMASTTMLLDARRRDWSDELLKKMGFPKELLCPIRQSGTLLGTLLPSVQEETGLGPVPVASVGGHDTASALAGIPFTGENQAFLSSGTWSLMGMEIDEPIITEESQAANFTNEGAVCGKIKFLKNISGLWIIQQLRKQWKTDFASLIQGARENLSCGLSIDPDDPSFTAPLNMENAITDYLVSHGQRAPKSHGETTAAVYLGLTEKYHRCIETLKKLTHTDIQAIHMVGGGIQDQLLCQLTMERTGLTVVTGPVEAAALGNVLMQEMAMGKISSLKEGRAQIAASFPVKFYRP